LEVPVTCIDIILAFWLALPGWYGDRHLTDAQRLDLWMPVAKTICRVAKTDTDRARAATQAYFEGSRLARYVIQGRCHQGPPGVRCDDGLAWGVWQVHRWCKRAWNKSLPVHERRDAALRCVLQAGRTGLRSCRGEQGWFSAQWSLHCTYRWAVRAAMARRLLKKLMAGEDAGKE
jgi:hypothetical protein